MAVRMAVQRLRVLTAAALLAVPMLAAMPMTTASAKYRLNPEHNIRPPSYVFGGDCASAPRSKGCTTLFVRALNDAREVMSEPHYKLPYRFTSLSGRERLLVLADQDRTLYGRVALSGLNNALDDSAKNGVEHNADPTFVHVNGNTPVRGASNWAAGSPPMTNPLYAYYLWMYDDGPGSGNLDCTKAGDPGCWGHRDGTLGAFGSEYKVLLGDAGGTSTYGYSWTELFEAFRQSDVTPLIPTVQGLNKHVGSKGTTVHVTGFGLSHTDRVTIVGNAATVIRKSQYEMDVLVPAGSGSGWLVVHTNGGTSSKNYASAFAYG